MYWFSTVYVPLSPLSFFEAESCVLGDNSFKDLDAARENRALWEQQYTIHHFSFYLLLKAVVLNKKAFS